MIILSFEFRELCIYYKFDQRSDNLRKFECTKYLVCDTAFYLFDLFSSLDN